MFLPVKSVGVMGDGRTYDYVVALRAVQTSDFMTADWAELPYALLKKVSSRIINEVRGINRVTYDVSQQAAGDDRVGVGFPCAVLPSLLEAPLRVCFIHQNMPGQYRHMIGALLERGDEVFGIGERSAIDRFTLRHPRLSLVGYALAPEDKRASVPPHLREFETQVARGQAVGRALHVMREKKFAPDLIVAHPGWGEVTFVRCEFPDVPLLGYCEFFYRASGADYGFDPEYPGSLAGLYRLQIRKLPHLLALDDIDAGICPTEWQRAQFPAEHQHKLTVIHEGIDTDALAPRPDAHVQIGDWQLAPASRSSPTSPATSSPTAASTPSCAACRTCRRRRRRRASWSSAATRSATACGCRPATATGPGC